MRSVLRRTIVGSGLAAALSNSPLLRTAKAQTYPQRPVKIIVPYAAGGASDIIARLISPELERALGQPLIVDNRGGGASMVGTQAVATASPDGHTIGIIDSAFVINPGLVRARLPYNTKIDFAPISLLATSPLVLVVHPSVAANSLQEFVALAKAQPGKINFASAGLWNRGSFGRRATATSRRDRYFSRSISRRRAGHYRSDWRPGTDDVCHRCPSSRWTSTTYSLPVSRRTHRNSESHKDTSTGMQKRANRQTFSVSSRHTASIAKAVSSGCSVG